MSDRRLLLVHAHPDDETIGNGATMARYVAEGVQVTLVTCTLGEYGEVLVPELEQLAADQGDQLGGYRIGELVAACAELRVTDVRFLGGPGRWSDSGMMGTPPNDGPRAFWRADLDEAARDLVAVVREVRPQVLVTYDENGGYGHPDHIQAHRVAMSAVDRCAEPEWHPELGPAWKIQKVYWNCVPRSVLVESLRVMKEAGLDFFGVESVDELPFGVDDSVVTAMVDGRAHLTAKMNAMRAHATQISVDGPFFALSNNVGQQAFGIEYYRLVRGDSGPASGESGWEEDLFGGIAG
ncbi:MAG: N-acetyl-1-D-myo-inositol-2-amino-2-deoxy-alpha-D-glucopyranoside deacetylase [Geodermatophilaceae bacterium]|jgi:N-acetyl-1-D-myo-inositol-2-amino-2-deoxy-alpha-D-glucopyranoside deacetylase|nr:N-acetyl-1-D-myo-inositol-2-amino-2-deoxy-alpha-D-glucopyranoside deacetylase [Geodermatophilaceae bacterium]